MYNFNDQKWQGRPALLDALKSDEALQKAIWEEIKKADIKKAEIKKDEIKKKES